MRRALSGWSTSIEVSTQRRHRRRAHFWEAQRKALDGDTLTTVVVVVVGRVIQEATHLLHSRSDDEEDNVAIGHRTVGRYRGQPLGFGLSKQKTIVGRRNRRLLPAIR